MGHWYDICPKCGVDLWKCYQEEQRKIQMEKYPDDCYCWLYGKIEKRDVSKDEFIERKVVKSFNPLMNASRDREVDVYKCHLCGKRYIHPEMVFA